MRLMGVGLHGLTPTAVSSSFPSLEGGLSVAGIAQPTAMPAYRTFFPTQRPGTLAAWPIDALRVEWSVNLCCQLGSRLPCGDNQVDPARHLPPGQGRRRQIRFS